MKKFIVIILLMGIAFAVNAKNAMNDVYDNQDFDFDVYFNNGTPGYFFCQAKPNVMFVSFVITFGMKIVGFSDDGYQSFPGAGYMDESSFNKVYFTANMNPQNPIDYGTIHIEYNGEKGDVECFQGKGNRTIEFGSGKI